MTDDVYFDTTNTYIKILVYESKENLLRVSKNWSIERMYIILIYVSREP